MDLYLIRHGESILDTRESFRLKIPEHKVYLTDNGVKQCHDAGEFLKNYLNDNKINMDDSVAWVSPFLVSRQSFDVINDYLNISDVSEDYSLVDQRLGLFGNISPQRNKMLFKDEFELYENYFKNDGEFYAKMPQGDSPMDVAIRTRQFLNMIFLEKKSPVFVLSHDTTIRTIVMNMFNLSPEWFNHEENMENCSIRLVNKNSIVDNYIYGGKVKRLL